MQVFQIIRFRHVALQANMARVEAERAREWIFEKADSLADEIDIDLAPVVLGHNAKNYYAVAIL